MPDLPTAHLADATEPTRLGRDQRRESLLDVAATMVAEGSVDSITMDSVAERAGVSRPLVYKHFADRNDLLDAVYKRETAMVHAELTAAVTTSDSVEAMFRALISGALQAQARRGAAFAALRAAGLRTRERRDEQRRRDRTTLRYFARQAQQEFGIDQKAARAGVSIFLGAVETVLAQWQLRPSDEHARLLEDTYVQLVLGGLRQLGRAQASGAAAVGAHCPDAR